LNAWVATLVLFSTVLTSLGLGVWAASWVVGVILDSFGRRREQEAAPVLVQSQAAGD